MHSVRPRETVILAKDRERLIRWYRDLLGFRITAKYESEYHYYNMETQSGIKIGIGDLDEMSISPAEPRMNAVLLQIEVDDVRAFMADIDRSDGATVFGPSYNEEDGFWFGAINDPEGNQIWVVDPQCP